MKIETEPRDDHQVRLVAEIEPEAFEKTKRQAARKISQETKIPGFRPGKAPYDMVRRFVGEDAIQKEAIELTIDQVYPEAIKQADITPGAPGSLDEIISVDPVKLAFIVPLAPKVDLGDYRSVELPYTFEAISDEKVDQFIEQLRASYATTEPVERPVQEGDMVYTTVTGTLTHPEEDKDPEIVKDRPAQLIVKQTEKSENEWPFAGFAMSLIGMSAGDEKTTTHAFPEDSVYETLRGKEVEFKATIQSVKSMTLPELNDEFAQSVGEFADLNALRASIRTGLEASAMEEFDQDYYSSLIDKIKEHATIQYPPQFIDDEIKSILNSIERDLAQQKMDLDTYLKVRQLDHEKFIEEEVKPAAVKRLERSLIIDEVARVEKIELKNQDVEASFSETLAELQNSGDFEQMRKNVGNNRLANAVAMEAVTRLMNRRVLERLKAIATGAPIETEQPAAETGDVETAQTEPKPADETSSAEAPEDDKPAE